MRQDAPNDEPKWPTTYSVPRIGSQTAAPAHRIFEGVSEVKPIKVVILYDSR